MPREKREEQKQAPCSDFVFTWQLRVLRSRWENKDKGVREAADPWKPQDTVESAAQQNPLWAEHREEERAAVEVTGTWITDVSNQQQRTKLEPWQRLIYI